MCLHLLLHWVWGSKKFGPLDVSYSWNLAESHKIVLTLGSFHLFFTLLVLPLLLVPADKTEKETFLKLLKIKNVRCILETEF